MSLVNLKAVAIAEFVGALFPGSLPPIHAFHRLPALGVCCPAGLLCSSAASAGLPPAPGSQAELCSFDVEQRVWEPDTLLKEKKDDDEELKAAKKEFSRDRCLRGIVIVDETPARCGGRLRRQL